MGNPISVNSRPGVTNKITIEEAYFLLRTAMWDQAAFAEYVSLYESKGYAAGFSDGRDLEADKDDGRWEAEYERGYDKGFKDGADEGYNEGYDDGYNQAAREF